MKKLFVLHTTAVTIEPLQNLAAELLPNCKVFNILDDSILPELGRQNGFTTVRPRVMEYVRIAAEQADLILSACSSLGTLIDEARQVVNTTVPIVRIDEAMAEKAILAGENIIVAATLATTLGPTLQLLNGKADELGKKVNITSLLVDSAFAALSAGDQEKHDAILGSQLSKAATKADVVVLAQASMASVLASIEELEQAKFLTSPRLGMEKVKGMLEP